MAAARGNDYWKARSHSGRKKDFASAEELWNECVAYFEWCDANPWVKVEQLKKPYPEKDDTGKIIKWIATIEIPTARPYTIDALCIHLDIDRKTFDKYSNPEGEFKESYKDFIPIASRVKNIIRNQKFEGAAVGAFNASIIARDLGLVDKQELQHGGMDDGNAIKVEIVRPDEE